MRTMDTKEALTVTEVAARLSVDRNTVAAWVKSGRLPGRKEGRCVLIPAAAVDAMRRQTCPQCGQPFTAKTVRQAYCGRPCAWAANHARRKAAHPATRGPGRPPKVSTSRPLDLSNERLRPALESTRPTA